MASAIPKSLPFSPLPEDAIARIFTFVEVDPRDYTRFAEVCQVCHEIVVKYGRFPLAVAYRALLPSLKQQAEDWAGIEYWIYDCEVDVKWNGSVTKPNLSILEAKKVAKANEFMSAFNSSLTTLQISLEHPNFNDYVLAAQKMIAVYFKKAGTRIADPILDEKIGKSQKKLYDHLLDDEAFEFSRFVKNITPESFKKHLALMHEKFKDTKLVQIETKIRQRITMANCSYEFEDLQTAYNDPSEQSPHFLAIRDDIRKKLESKQKALENELKILRGPSGCNGTVQKAFETMEQAKKKWMSDDNFINNYVTVLTITASGEWTNDAYVYTASGEWTKDAYVYVTSKYLEDRKAYNALVKKAEEIERIERGPTPIKRGLLPDVIVALKPTHLDAAAHAEMQKMANFYHELSQHVDETNQAERSAALHQIID